MVVYLTYSYDEQDRLGWIFSTQHGVFEGTPPEAESILDLAILDKHSEGGIRYENAQFFDTKEEALEAQENYEAEIATPAPKTSQNGSEDFSNTIPAPPKSKPALWERLIDWLFIE